MKGGQKGANSSTQVSVNMKMSASFSTQHIFARNLSVQTDVAKEGILNLADIRTSAEEEKSAYTNTMKFAVRSTTKYVPIIKLLKLKLSN